MIHIEGVEFTQGIQTYRSPYPVCGPATSRVPCPDNSVPLIEGKPMAVRVYLGGSTMLPLVRARATFTPADPLQLPAVYSNAGATTSVGHPNRLVGTGSHNINVPPTLPAGEYGVLIEILDNSSSSTGPALATHRTEVTVFCRDCVMIRLLRMRYRGRGLNIPPPTLAKFRSMTEPMFRQWLPSPQICVVHESEEAFDGAFTTRWDSDDPAENGTTGTLWKILQRVRTAESFPPTTIYLALYPDAAGPNGGAGGPYDGIAPDVIPWILIHEIGHCLGLSHAPTATGPDPDFPRYGFFQQGSIGEVGFDPVALTTHGPHHVDFMGYQEPFWVSPYNYMKLFDSIGPCQFVVDDDPIAPPIREVVFSCVYSLALPDLKLIRKICGPKIERLFPFPYPKLPPNLIRRFAATLYDRNGKTLYRDQYGLVRSAPHNDTATLTIYVPALEGAYRLVVSDDQVVLEDAILETDEPRLDATVQQVRKGGSHLRVQWKLDANAEVPVVVRASTDGGNSWVAQMPDEGRESLDFDLRDLPLGDSVIVEVVAGSRLATATWRSEELPLRTGLRKILSARVIGKDFREGDPVYGEAILPNRADPNKVEWSSDQIGFLGKGSLVLMDLPTGQHRIRVSHTRWGVSRFVATVRVRPHLDTPNDFALENRIHC